MPRSLVFVFLALASPPVAQTVLVLPYLQPGNGSTFSGSDVKVLGWLTDQKPGEFIVEYAAKGARQQAAPVERVQLDFGPAKIVATPTPTPVPKATPDPITNADDLKEVAARSASPPIPERSQHYFKYSAVLSGLPFDSEVSWRVRLGQKVIREGIARTRVSAGKPCR